MRDSAEKEKARLEVAERRKNDLMASHRIWHKRIRVLVPRYAALTPTQLQYYGTCYSEGFTKEERNTYNTDVVYMWMSTNRQIELYSEGIPIAYPNRMIAISVYQDIKQHIQNWSELLTRSLNKRTKAPPVEDFDLMLEFAENLEVYLDYYYHHIKSKDFEPFHKRTMNRFVNTDKYTHRGDSTYTKLRTGIYSFLGERTARVETPVARIEAPSDSSHYQEQPMLTDDDLAGFDPRRLTE